MHAGSSVKRLAPPGEADTLFNPGDLWWQKNYAARVSGLRARTGVRLVQMVHDLYLIDRPEWTPSDAVRVFGDQLQRIASVVDRWLVSSQFMKGRLERYLAERSLPARPITIIPMGWDSFRAAGASDRAPVDGSYILFVGTVEPRKNLRVCSTRWRSCGSNWATACLASSSSAVPAGRRATYRRGSRAHRAPAI